MMWIILLCMEICYRCHCPVSLPSLMLHYPASCCIVQSHHPFKPPPQAASTRRNSWQGCMALVTCCMIPGETEQGQSQMLVKPSMLINPHGLCLIIWLWCTPHTLVHFNLVMVHSLFLGTLKFIYYTLSLVTHAVAESAPKDFGYVHFFRMCWVSVLWKMEVSYSTTAKVSLIKVMLGPAHCNVRDSHAACSVLQQPLCCLCVAAAQARA